jgi:glycosyltransferase involved in cell wall biosynthesis
MNTLVIIPAYNEEANIAVTVRSAKHHLPDATILVIDDGSTDATQRLASDAGAVVISSEKNRGYGSTLKMGYRIAVGCEVDHVLQLDADGQHDPQYLPVLRAALKGHDVVIGSRFLGGSTYKIPFFRRSGMRLFSFISEQMGVAVSDTTSGYRAYSARAVIEVLRIPWEYPDVNLLIELHRAGIKIVEVPVKMYANQQGKSMHSGLEPVRYVATTLTSLLRGRAV